MEPVIRNIKSVFKKAGTITVFSFDAGEGLSEHTAPYDAVLMVTDGEAEVQIDGKPFTVRTGEMIIMPANKPHALQAKARFKMLLILIKKESLRQYSKQSLLQTRETGKFLKEYPVE